MTSVVKLEPPGPPPGSLRPADEAVMARARAATEALVRQRKVPGPVGAMMIPSQRGVLVAVGGVDGELYVNGQALTEQWAARLRSELPDVASDVARLQAMRGSGRTRRRRNAPWSWAGAPIRTAAGSTARRGAGAVTFPSVAGVRGGAGRGSVRTGRWGNRFRGTLHGVSVNDRTRQDAESPAAAAAGPEDVGRLLCDQLVEAISAIRSQGAMLIGLEFARAGEGEGDEAVLTEPDDRAE